MTSSTVNPRDLHSILGLDTTPYTGLYFLNQDGTNAYDFGYSPAMLETIYVQADNVSLGLANTAGAEVYDEGKNLHISIAPNASAIVLGAYETDPGFRIDLYGSGYKSNIDAIQHLQADWARLSGVALPSLHAGAPDLFVLGGSASTVLPIRNDQIVVHS